MAYWTVCSRPATHRPPRTRARAQEYHATPYGRAGTEEDYGSAVHWNNSVSSHLLPSPPPPPNCPAALRPPLPTTCPPYHMRAACVPSRALAFTQHLCHTTFCRLPSHLRRSITTWHILFLLRLPLTSPGGLLGDMTPGGNAPRCARALRTCAPFL